MGHTYTNGYYLVNGIYLEWPIFVKTHHDPKEEKYSQFVKEQEDSRKEVEQEFHVLQSRWAIVRHPTRQWSLQHMWEVITACVIIHNMIVGEECDASVYDQGWDY
jgi:hypothetical protein